MLPGLASGFAKAGTQIGMQEKPMGHLQAKGPFDVIATAFTAFRWVTRQNLITAQPFGGLLELSYASKLHLRVWKCHGSFF